jgi:hypothetical protein
VCSVIVQRKGLNSGGILHVWVVPNVCEEADSLIGIQKVLWKKSTGIFE